MAFVAHFIPSLFIPSLACSWLDGDYVHGRDVIVWCLICHHDCGLGLESKGLHIYQKILQFHPDKTWQIRDKVMFDISIIWWLGLQIEGFNARLLNYPSLAHANVCYRVNLYPNKWGLFHFTNQLNNTTVWVKRFNLSIQRDEYFDVI